MVCRILVQLGELLFEQVDIGTQFGHVCNDPRGFAQQQIGALVLVFVGLDNLIFFLGNIAEFRVSVDQQAVFFQQRPGFTLRLALGFPGFALLHFLAAH